MTFNESEDTGSAWERGGTVLINAHQILVNVFLNLSQAEVDAAAQQTRNYARGREHIQKSKKR